jgi:hypothetical protein
MSWRVLGDSGSEIVASRDFSDINHPPSAPSKYARRGIHHETSLTADRSRPDLLELRARRVGFVLGAACGNLQAKTETLTQTQKTARDFLEPFFLSPLETNQ